MKYILSEVEYNEEIEAFEKTEEYYLEDYDVKPEVGELVITKDNKQFLVRAIVHRSKELSALAENEASTTELLVSADNLFLEQ